MNGSGELMPPFTCSDDPVQSIVTPSPATITLTFNVIGTGFLPSPSIWSVNSINAVRNIANLRTRQPLGVVVQVTEIGRHRFAPVAAEQIGHVAFARRACRHLGLQVAHQQIRQPHIERDQSARPASTGLPRSMNLTIGMRMPS